MSFLNSQIDETQSEKCSMKQVLIYISKSYDNLYGDMQHELIMLSQFILYLRVTTKRLIQ